MRATSWQTRLTALVVTGTVVVVAVLAVADRSVTSQREPGIVPEPPRSTTTPVSSDLLAKRVHWYEWGPAAFARAQREDKLVFLDLTAAWCYACHVMDATTYMDPEVIRLLSQQYIAVRVDSDRRPDIDARYRQGGWPTVSILLHSGEILFHANFLEGPEMSTALTEADALFREHRREVFERVGAVWEQVEAAARAPSPRNAPINSGVIEQSAAMIEARYDREHGGFREAPKFFEPHAVSLAFLRYHQTGQESWKQIALATLDAQLRLFDPVWGGFYRYAEKADWSKPHYEKLLAVQATNLSNYLEAYQVTHDDAYRSVVERIIDYVNRFLLNPDRTGFYSSQAGGVQPDPARDRFVSSHDYFALPAKERASLGIPTVDSRIYTSSNALMISSYLQASQVLGREELKSLALRVLDGLHRQRYVPGRGVRHQAEIREGTEFMLLADQTRFAQALADAFVTTGDRRYLQQARQVVGDLVATLADPKGGFLDRPQTSSQGLLRLAHKPLEENLHLAMLFCDLFYLTGDAHYRVHAKSSLQYLLGIREALPLAQVGLAVDRFVRYPLHLVVVGAKDLHVTRALFAEAHHVYAPGKIVRLLDPDTDDLAIGAVTFPRADGPRAYVCTDRFCSKPIARPDELKDHARVVMAVGSRDRAETD